MTDYVSPPASSFPDRLGRRWTLDLKYGDFTRLRNSSLQVDLLTLGNSNDDAAKQLLSRLAGDEVFLVSVIYELLAPQIEARKITPEEFAEGLDGSVIDAALDALIEGIANFSRPQRGQMIRKVWSKMKSLESSMSQTVQEELDKMTPQVTDRATKKMQREFANLLDRLEA